jgi:plastocyanin
MKRGMLLCTIVVLGAVVGLPGVASAGGGCHGGVTQQDTTAQDDATVRIVDCRFTANITTVQPGTTVTFVNEDWATHNVTGNDWGHFEDMRQGDAFTATFSEPGIYPFACTYHPGMTGAIVVGDGKGVASGETITVEPFEAPAPPTETRVLAAEDEGVSTGLLAATAFVGVALGAGITVGLTRAGRKNATA